MSRSNEVLTRGSSNLIGLFTAVFFLTNLFAILLTSSFAFLAQR